MKKSIFTCLFYALLALICLKFAANAQPVNCPRGVAVPVLKKSVYPLSTFKIGKDKRTGTESVILDYGDSLIVKSWGCEYYVLTFRFVTSRYRHNTADLEFWFRNAVSRMEEVYPGIEAPIDIVEGTAKLRSYIETQRKLHKVKLGEQITFGGGERDPNGDDILQRVSVDRVQKLKSGRYAVEVTFSAGPL